MISFEESFELVGQLIKDFKANEKAYLSSGYSEADVRQDFINKFFIALGWDVTHNFQKNPHEQEVKIEEKVITKRADYAFYIAPNFRDVVFFVEAKKPSHNLKNPDYYHQVSRYGWNASTPLAVLTDFEEFHVIDCRYRPSISDALNRKVMYFHYSEYANEEKFKDIFYLFGRDEVVKGSIDNYVANKLPNPRGKAIQRGFFKGGYKSVDVDFLETLDGYRKTLATAFKKENQELDGEELTEAVQRTIDRLVFIRFLEDKGIEEPEIISLYQKPLAWKAFIALCKRLEPKYNGLIFKPHRILDGKDFHSPDDRIFADICAELSDPSSPYDFNIIPISILGSIYERFLGKVIHTTPTRANVQDKPEVRKAGGVYYTPEYIVRYIVSETVGKIIIDKTPDEIAKMSFADIACGSGSFLIEVYSQLLEYHVRWYNINRDNANTKEIYEREGYLHVSLKKKKDILLNNIYGVDIDFQATEVTQLSLYLKLLEDVTTYEAHQTGMFKEQVLPNLNNNIICGNSLIGTDINTGELFGNKEPHKLKPMNFEDAFPSVIRCGGFEAIIGNPPYGADFDNEQKSYFSNKYPSIIGQPESYEYFIYVGKELIKDNGFLSFITPTNFIESDRAENLRKTLLNGGNIRILSSFRYNVWKNNAAETLVFVFKKTSKKRETIIVHPNNPEEFVVNMNSDTVAQTDWEKTPKHRFLIRANVKLIQKIEKSSKSLGSICEIGQGIIVYKTRKDSEANLYIAAKEKGKDWKRLLDTSSTIKRYGLEWGGKYLKYGKWLWRSRESRFFEEPKILFGRLRNKSLERKLIGTLDENKFYNRDNFNNIISRDKNYSLKYILALFNSKLLNYWYKAYFDNVNINPEQTNLIPIHTIDHINQSEKSKHDHIVNLVEEMVKSKEGLKTARLDSDVQRLEHHCNTLDHKIDEAVYELYGLTEEEIKIVEGKK